MTEPIAPDTVRDALHALRYSKRLSDNPLTELDLIRVGLREEGLADQPQTRAWLLGKVLAGAIEEESAGRRDTGSSSTGSLTEGAPRHDSATEAVEALREAFRAGSMDREAWGILAFRFLSEIDNPVERATEITGYQRRTLHRRTTRGFALLAKVLRDQEMAARRTLESDADLPLDARIVVKREAPEHQAAALLGEILEVVRGKRGVLRITAGQLAAAASYPVAELAAYRLGRIAAWSRPQFNLDERFVGLSLLVDLGETSGQERWQVRERRFGDLRAALSEVEEPSIVLLGPPGSGKSTLLRRLELELSREALTGDGDPHTTPLTFLVSLSQYRSDASGEPPRPIEWLSERWSAAYPNLPDLQTVMAQGEMIFLLDGLNEMPYRGEEDYRARVLQWKQFLHEDILGNHRAVIACRSLDYSVPLSTPSLRVPHVRLESMTDDMVQAFLERYSPGNKDEVWPELVDTEVLEIVRWPFFLKLLVEEVADGGAMPEGLAALLTSFVRRALIREVERDNPLFAPNGLVDSRDLRRLASARGWGTSTELPTKGMLFPQLARLADGMQRWHGGGQSQVRVDYERALQLLGEPKSEDVVLGGRALGLLDEDRVNDELMFIHQLLQEYFAGRSLAVHPNTELVRRPWRAADVSPSIEDVIGGLEGAEALPVLPATGWEETTLLAAEMADDADSFLHGLMEANLWLAARAADGPTLKRTLSADLLDALRWALVERTRDPAADLRDRLACGDALGQLGDPRFEQRTGSYGPYIMPPLVAISGGSYPIGGDKPIDWSIPAMSQTNTAHIPRHMVEVAGFRIGRFLVTNAEFARFVEAGGYDDERWWDTADARAWHRGELVNEGAKANNQYLWERFREDPKLMERYVEEGRFATDESVARWRVWLTLDEEAFEAELDAHWKVKRASEPGFFKDPRFNRPSQPVRGICWYEARAYCAWLGAQVGMDVRLPTEVEWEAAAAGQAGRAYPYGDVYDPLAANMVDTHIRRPSPVGSFPAGRTPDGVNDMAGNLAEWTSSLFGGGAIQDYETKFPYPYDPTDGREDPEAGQEVRRVVRGGDFQLPETHGRTVFRDFNRPTVRSGCIGFRVVVGSTSAKPSHDSRSSATRSA